MTSKRCRGDGEANDGSAVLAINVGGRIFSACRSTLRFEKNSMLAKLFDEDSPFGELSLDQEGRPFLDRNGDDFAHILDYLRRGGRLVGAEKLGPNIYAKLRDEAEFFGLAGLVDAVNDAEAAADTSHKEAEERAEELTIAAEQRVSYLCEERTIATEQRADELCNKRKRYKHEVIGPMRMGSGYNAYSAYTDESQTRFVEESERLRRFADASKGWRVAHMSVDVKGDYYNLLLEQDE